MHYYSFLSFFSHPFVLFAVLRPTFIIYMYDLLAGLIIQKKWLPRFFRESHANMSDFRVSSKNRTAQAHPFHLITCRKFVFYENFFRLSSSKNYIIPFYIIASNLYLLFPAYVRSDRSKESKKRPQISRQVVPPDRPLYIRNNEPLEIRPVLCQTSHIYQR